MSFDNIELSDFSDPPPDNHAHSNGIYWATHVQAAGAGTEGEQLAQNTVRTLELMLRGSSGGGARPGQDATLFAGGETRQTFDIT
jgi:hypothetical protein